MSGFAAPPLGQVGLQGEVQSLPQTQRACGFHQNLFPQFAPAADRGERHLVPAQGRLLLIHA